MLRTALYCSPAAGLLVLFLVVIHGDVLPHLDGINPALPGSVAVAVILLVLRLRSRGGRVSVVAGHIHGGTRHRTARHEAGHWVAAKAVGGRPTSATIHNNGGGFVSWTGTRGSDRQQVVAAVAFLDAGRRALGSSEGCSGDKDSIRATLRYLPSAERSAARREGEAWARRIVSSRSGEIRRVASRLDQHGRL